MATDVRAFEAITQESGFTLMELVVDTMLRLAIISKGHCYGE